VDTPAFAIFFALLTVVTNLFVLATVAVALAARTSKAWDDRAAAWRATLAPDAIALAAVVALVTMLGSLYLSEIAHYPPCEMCWYQRIAMYPLTILLGIAVWRRDRGIRHYVLPLTAIGAVLSIYHYQLERFPDQSSLSCSVSVPCTTVWIWKFHYISIPFMALSAFVTIATLLLIAGRDDVDDEYIDDADLDSTAPLAASSVTTPSPLVLEEPHR
jgi:disulfide bond formation protein DsbB